MRLFSHLPFLIGSVAGCLWLGALASPAWAGPAEDQFAVAAAQYSRGRWKLAVDEFQQYLSSYATHTQADEARFFLGEALMQLGRPADAREHFDAFSTAKPQHRFAAQALFRRGECAYLTGDYDAARRHLTAFHNNHADNDLNAYALPYLGDLALMASDGPQAQAYYAEALRKHGDTPLADQCRFGLARALQLQHRYDDAARFYQFLIDKPQSPLADDALLQLGRLQYERKTYDEALSTLSTLLANYPDSEVTPYAHYWTGMTQLAKDEMAPAIGALEKAALAPQEHPLTPAIRFQLGEAFRRGGRMEEAAAHYQMVVEQSPQSTWVDDAQHGLLRLASDTNQHAALEQAAQQFLKDHPESSWAYDVRRLLGRAQLKQEKFDAAIATLDPLLAELEKIAAGPNDAGDFSRSDAELLANSTRFLLGLSYVGADKFAEANETIAAIAADEQADPQMVAGVASVQAAALMGQEKYAEAISPLRSYLRLTPDGPDANMSRAQLAIALAKTKQFAEAQQVYDALAKTFTDRTEFLNATHVLAEAAFAAGEKPWARELFATLADEQNPAEFREKGLSGKAWSELDLKAPVRSAETFERLLKDFPDSPLIPQAALARASALQQAGEQDGALAMYSLIIDEYPQSKQLPEALHRAAKLHDQLQQDKQAEVLLQRYLREYPNRGDVDEALYRLAWVLKDQQRDDEALDVFAEIYRDHKTSKFWPDATYRLAEQAAVKNNYEQVKKLVGEIVDAGASDTLLSLSLYLKGQMAAKVGKWDEVTGPMQQVLSQYPNSPQATAAEYWSAEALYRQGKYDESAERFKLLARRTEGESDTWLAIIPLRQAQVLAHKRKWAAAQALAEDVAEKYPGFSQQYEVDYLLGRCHANQARFDDARQAFERVVTSPHGRRTETAAMAQWNIGETYFHQKQYEDAIRAYSRVELLYDFPRWQALSLLQMGKCYQNLEKWDEAAARYQQILDEFANTDSSPEAARLLQTAQEKARTASNTPADEEDTTGQLDARGPNPNESR